MAEAPVPLDKSPSDFVLDLKSFQLIRSGRPVKLEKIPMELLTLLVRRRGELVSREEIVRTLWNDGVHVDVDAGINTAIRKIRLALDDNPASPRYLETVVGKGYRFIGPVENPKEDPKEVSAVEVPGRETAPINGDRTLVSELDGWLQARRLRLVEQDQDHAEEKIAHAENTSRQGIRSARKWLFIGAASLAMASIVALLAVRSWRDASRLPTAAPRKTVLAVLPFENLSRDPDQDFFSDGLTEEMIAQVGKLNRDQLTVVARSAVAKYKGSSLTAKEIGGELNADYLVQGSVRRAGDRVRVTAQLIQSKSQTDVWTESYDRELKDVLTVQDSVVRSIASQIHISLTEEQKMRLANSPQARPEAYVAYLKGRYYWNKRTGESIQKAEQYFQQAIDSDPTYAAAYSGLADCNSGLSWHGFKSPADALPKAYAAARKAIEMNPQSAEAHASLGLVLSHRWDWPGAEAEFRRALELDPQYANAHHWYGDYLSIKSRHDQALSEARRALELDPLNLMISTWVGLRYYMAGNYSAAIKQNRESVDLDPNFAAAHLLLGDDYVQVGDYGEGIRELRSAASLSGESPLYIAQVAVGLAKAGQRREALRIAHELEAASSKRYVSPYGLAQIYAAANSKNQTFKWLQAAYDDHAVWMGYLAVDPIFNPYRSDQRFQDLLKRIDLL